MATMEKWILSANSNYFDHATAFHTLGYIDWKQTRNYNVGDIVYVYVTKPASKIQFKTRVTVIGMTAEEVSDLSKYWIKGEPDKNDKQKYARLELLKEFDDNRLSFEELQKHGLLYAPQSPCRVKKELQVFLNSVEE